MKRNKRLLTKSSLAEFITQKRMRLAEENGFDPGNGWAQVSGKGEEINRAYGEYQALLMIAEVFRVNE